MGHLQVDGVVEEEHESWWNQSKFKGKGNNWQSKKVQALQKKIQNQKKEIASLKKRTTPDEPDSESEWDEPQHDAGNLFGGRPARGKANTGLAQSC